MDIRWTAHLQDPERREEFRKLLNNSTTVFSRLLQILEEEERNIERKENSPDDFSDPSWSHKQAFRNGDRSRLQRIKDLLSFVTTRK